MTDEAEPLAAVAGRNARRIRLDAGLTLAEVAEFAQWLGLKWSAGKVGDFESGRVSPTLPTLYVVAGLLSSISPSGPITLSELFDGHGLVRMNPRVVPALSDVRAALEGVPVELSGECFTGGPQAKARAAQDALNEAVASLPRYLGIGTLADGWRSFKRLQQGLDAYGEAEQRVARDLGIDRYRMVAECLYLWGRTFSAERDRRAGPAANAQARGRTSRELKAELRASIETEGRDRPERGSNGER